MADRIAKVDAVDRHDDGVPSGMDVAHEDSAVSLSIPFAREPTPMQIPRSMEFHLDDDDVSLVMAWRHSEHHAIASFGAAPAFGEITEKSTPSPAGQPRRAESPAESNHS